MTVNMVLEFAVVIAAIFFGSRCGGVGLGLWGGVGVLVLTYGFGLPPTSPPVDVMLIILAVIMATAVMEAAGGIDFLVGVAERIIRRSPRHFMVVAPVVAYIFTLGAGDWPMCFILCFRLSSKSPMKTASGPNARSRWPPSPSQDAITASPASAAMAAMIALYEPAGFGLTQIILICLPATLIGVIVAALVQTWVGKELRDDPEYNRRLQAGEIEKPKKDQADAQKPDLPAAAKISAMMFLVGVALIVLAASFPACGRRCRKPARWFPSTWPPPSRS